MKARSKSFKMVEDDYLFFEQCVDEIERTLEVWQPWLALLRKRGKPLRILDFGCGRGSFTLQAIKALDLPADQVTILLLEPAEEHRAEALRHLALSGYRDCHPIANLEDLETSSIDLIWSHHVFYYVPNLEPTLREMKRCMSNGSLFLCAVSGEESGAGSLQEAALSTGGLEPPYRSGVQVCETLVQEFKGCVVEPYQIRIEMKDTLENRESLMRFLVGEYRDRVDWPRCLLLFDQYSDGKTIRVPSSELSIRYLEMGLEDGSKTHTLG